MAENKKCTTPVTVLTNPTDKKARRSWKWREEFCREIGVPFLYGKTIAQVPEKELSVMIGACAEREQYALTMTLAVLQLIHELTVLPRLQRPRRGLREVWRRMRAYYLLAQVVCNMARECRDVVDAFVQRVLGILQPQSQQKPVIDAQAPANEGSKELENKLKELENRLNEQAATQRSLNEQLEAAKKAANRLEAMLCEKQQDGAEQISVAELQDSPQAESEIAVPDEDLPMLVVDLKALERVCDEHYAGEVIVPISVAREKCGNKGNYDAWAQQVSKKYGLFIKIGRVPAKELPNPSVSRQSSGLSANAYLTVKYGLGVAVKEGTDIRVEFDDPDIKNLYMQELDKLLAKRAKRA